MDHMYGIDLDCWIALLHQGGMGWPASRIFEVHYMAMFGVQSDGV